MSFFYAQINEDGIVYAISQLVEEIDRYDLVQIETYDQDILGKRYETETGVFEEVIQPIISPTPTLQEQITILQQDNLNLMMGLTGIYEELLALKTGGTV